MKILKALEAKIEEIQKYVDVKNDKFSKVMKFFQDEMYDLDNAGFTKTEQVEIFSTAFDRKDIKYITYVSLFNRYIRSESSTPIEEQKEQKIESPSEEKKEVSSSPIEDEHDEGYSAMVDVKRKPDLSIKDLPQDILDQMK